MSADATTGPPGRDHAELPAPPTWEIIYAVVEAAAQANRYPTSPDCAPLRTALAAHHGVQPDWVTVGPGSLAVIGSAMAVVCAAGSGALVRSTPGFDALDRLAAAHGLPVRRFPLPPGDRLDVRPLAHTATSGVDSGFIVVSSPHSPTGGVLTTEQMEWLLDHAPAGMLVLLDQAYQEFTTAAGAVDGAALVGDWPNLIVTRSFSKGPGLAGLRVGYALGQRARELARHGVPYWVSGPSEQAALAALADRERLDREVLNVIGERARLAAYLRTHLDPDDTGVVVEGEGNFLWIRDAEPTLLRQAGVRVQHWPGQGVRITIGSRRDSDRLLDAWFG